MHIQMAYELTPDDYYAFQRGYTKNRRSLTPRNQRGWRSPGMVLLVAMAVLILVMWNIPWDWFSPPPPPAPAMPAPPPAPPLTSGQFLLSLVPFLILLAMIWGFIMWLRHSKLYFRRLALQIMRVGEPRTAEITDTHLTIREPRAVIQMEWGHFIRFVEMPSVFLLFVTPRVGHILPKRGFPSTEAMTEFRTFAQVNVGNEPRGFPVQPATLPR